MAYPRHDYAYVDERSIASMQAHSAPQRTPSDGPRRRAKQLDPPPKQLSSHGPLPRAKQPSLSPEQPPSHRPVILPKSRQELYKDALKDVSLGSGTYYNCTQSDLDVTGGLARQDFPDNSYKDLIPARKKWFAKKNRGPFISAEKAASDICRHNRLDKKIENRSESKAIGRLSEAIAAGRNNCWGPDLIIKAFCDLDTVFFRGRLRSHVCIRWLPNWEEESYTTWGNALFFGEGKSSIRMNADTILLQHPDPFEQMFRTMLEAMW